MFTEHYSAVVADVEDPSDPSTALNVVLINILELADILFVMGEASSHCVANTMRDIINKFGIDSAKKVVLLKDCMSPVPNFEKFEEDFFSEMRSKGVRIMKSDEIFVNGGVVV
jgi:nicotinamidase-related amidase